MKVELWINLAILIGCASVLHWLGESWLVASLLALLFTALSVLCTKIEFAGWDWGAKLAQRERDATTSKRED